MDFEPLYRHRPASKWTNGDIAAKVGADLGLPPLNPEQDRVMICGSSAMLRDLKHICEARGLKEGNTSTPGAFVIERAFADS